MKNIQGRIVNLGRTVQGNDSSLKKVLYTTFPEILNAIFLVFLPVFIDVLFIAQLKSASSFGAIGLSNNFVHLFFKLAEGMSTAGIIIMGRYHGGKDFYNCGQAFVETLFASLLLAFAQFVLIGLGAKMLFIWMGASAKVIEKSTMCLQFNSIAIGFLFINMSIMSFFRATGNVTLTFVINGLATLLFVYLDYALVLGKFGYAPVGFLGSAMASSARQIFATVLGVLFICVNRRYHKYFYFQQIKNLTLNGARRIFKIGLPVTLDKLSIVVAYIWLAKMVAPAGAKAIACADIVKNLERLAFIPATALSQVVTALVSNYIGSNDPTSARKASGYAISLAVVATLVTMGTICCFSQTLVGLFDYKKKITSEVILILCYILPIVSFDILQLMASAALRGAGDVQTVLRARCIGCFGIFIPLSFIVSKYPFQSIATKILAIYVCFYLATAVIGFLLVKRICGTAWLEDKIIVMPAQKTKITQKSALEL